MTERREAIKDLLIILALPVIILIWLIGWLLISDEDRQYWYDLFTRDLKELDRIGN